MELDRRSVVAYLNDEGFAQLRGLLGLEEKDSGFAAVVRRTNGFGVWLSPAGGRWSKILVAPWHYFRAFELRSESEEEAGAGVRRQIGFRS